jgi:hypothetical protein
MVGDFPRLPAFWKAHSSILVARMPVPKMVKNGLNSPFVILGHS